MDPPPRMSSPAALQKFSLTNDVIKRYYDLATPTPKMMEAINSLNRRLVNFLAQKFGSFMRTDVFGSYKSGFASMDSDVDICLRFDAEETAPEDIDVNDVIAQVATLLSDRPWVGSSQAIFAKVPIVRCEILRPLKISMDIAYYNTMALQNGRLLEAYCAWEPERLPQLGVWVKKWAKEGEICNSRVGYPSSYAFIILLIHFLQKCDPPVLPRLQENSSEYHVEHSSGWNVYFNEAVEPNWSRNRQSVGELFRGFLHYYASFDFRNEVVQIRRKWAMTKAEKREECESWRGDSALLAIEDPFELARNHCVALTRNKFERIRKYFERSAKLFNWLEALDGEALGWYGVRTIEQGVNFVIADMLKRCYVDEEATAVRMPIHGRILKRKERRYSERIQPLAERNRNQNNQNWRGEKRNQKRNSDIAPMYSRSHLFKRS